MLKWFYGMRTRKLLLLSSSRLYGYAYLEHAKPELVNLFKEKNVKTVLFVPYALPDHDNYTAQVAQTLNSWGIRVEGLHKKNNIIDAVRNAEAIFVGGGNTFVLLKTLYDLRIIDAIRTQVLDHGTPYIGSSAGTNVATRSINTTNDMPIVYPPTFKALDLIPFNINPHYVETATETEQKGETRDERINEFVMYHKRPVLGLREGSSLLVDGDKATIKGVRSAKLFRHDEPTVEYKPETDVSFLLDSKNLA